jgi:hypothetical protein
MTRAIWITGRAATGKSTLIRELTARLTEIGQTPSVVTDEEILLGLVRADVGHRHHSHPQGDHRISFTDGHLFDQGVIELGHRVDRHLSEEPGAGPVIVELARGCAPIDVSYQRALDLLDPRLWARSRVYRLDVPWPVQTIRNHQRLHGSGKGPDLAILRQLYRRDDPRPFTAAGIAVTTLPPASPAYLAQQVLYHHATRPSRQPG